MLINHTIAFILGFILDLIIGDPYNIPHPVRLMGRFILLMDEKLLGKKGAPLKGTPGKRRVMGVFFCLTTVGLTFLITGGILFFSYKIHYIFGIAVEAVLTCYCLATKSLKDESMKVYDALMTGDIAMSRRAVSMIVGRDTEALDETGIIRATVETVAENASDGVIAPMLYAFLFGPVASMSYKAVNTMDSMVGYHNDRYEDFGFFSAKLDDVFNFIPSRLGALFMILAAFVAGSDYSGKRAFEIFKRDRYNHKSPNSAQTESACAGALSVRLAGDASYFGKIVKKPFIGDDYRPVEREDIKRACRLLYVSVFICFFFSSLFLVINSFIVIYHYPLSVYGIFFIRRINLKRSEGML